MKKFIEWLNDKKLMTELTSSSGKVRASSGDLTNISIGAGSPYRQFGHSNRPNWLQTAAASVQQGIGDRMRKELGDLDPVTGIIPPDMSIFQRDNLIQDEMVLQLPIGENLDVPDNWKPISSYNKRQTFRNVYQAIQDPQNDPRVFNVEDISNADNSNKFKPYTDDMENQKPIFGGMSFYQAAVEFTTALSKIKLYNHLNQTTNKNIKDIIDLENPKIEKQQIRSVGNIYKLINVFKYERKKTAVGDYDMGGNYFSNDE